MAKVLPPTLNSANTCCDACTIIHVINVVIKCLNHKCLIIICFDNMLVAFTFICNVIVLFLQTFSK